MATDTAVSTRPVDVGLKREMGLIGAMWASETSIIGSGWLFGSFFAAQYLGPAAIWAWIAGGVAIIILALVHAELGGMYPVAGGTARFPHLAFGSGAGISFGFFSWLQAVTVAPIECYAIERYGQYWLDAAKINIYDPISGNVTHLGFVITIVLTGDHDRRELLRHALVQQGERGHHLVEGSHPGPRDHRVAVQVPPQQLQRAGRT